MTGVVSRCGVSDCRVWYGNRADTNGTHTHTHTRIPQLIASLNLPCSDQLGGK